MIRSPLGAIPMIRKPPEQRPDAASRVLYQRLLTRMRKDLELLLAARLYPVLPSLVKENAEDLGMRRDSAFDRLSAIFSGLAVVYGLAYSDEQIAAELSAIGLSVQGVTQAQVSKQLAAIGITPVVHNTYNQTLLRSFVKENVGLVKNVTSGQIAQLEQIVMSGFRRGIHVDQMRREIEAKLSVNRTRASLLARDQILKLQGEFTEVAQTSAGITDYIWRTVKDERVREGHRGLEGTRQKWSSPPIVSSRKGMIRRAHPKGDYQCRCYAEPVMSEYEEGEQPSTEAQTPEGAPKAGVLASAAGFAIDLLLSKDKEENEVYPRY